MSTTLAFGPATGSIAWDYENVLYPANAKDVNSIAYSGPALTNGTGAGNANKIYKAQLALAASGTTTLNLSSLTDSFGNTLSFTIVKHLYIENSALGTSTAIAVGNAGVNPFAGIWSPGTATLSVRNGARMEFGTVTDATGYAVGSGVNILITNSDGAHGATVNVLIVGV